jgi:hypothetical protein
MTRGEIGWLCVFVVMTTYAAAQLCFLLYVAITGKVPI